MNWSRPAGFDYVPTERYEPTTLQYFFLANSMIIALMISMLLIGIYLVLILKRHRGLETGKLTSKHAHFLSKADTSVSVFGASKIRIIRGRQICADLSSAMFAEVRPKYVINPNSCSQPITLFCHFIHVSHFVME